MIIFSRRRAMSLPSSWRLKEFKKQINNKEHWLKLSMQSAESGQKTKESTLPRTNTTDTNKSNSFKICTLFISIFKAEFLDLSCSSCPCNCTTC